MFYLNVNGVKTACVTYGDADKPALIPLHGMAASSSGYRSMLGGSFIERASEDFFVVAYDRRCHGKTGYPESFTFDEQASDVTALMDALCIEKASVLGESAGSYIAGRAAILNPDRISHLVLLVSNSHAEGVTPLQAAYQRLGINPKNMGTKDVEALMGVAFAPDTPMELRQEILSDSFKGRSDFTFPADKTAAGFAALAHFDNREGFRTLQVPTLVVSGKYDGINPPAVGKEIAAMIPNGRFLEMEHSGHFVYREQPDDLAAAVKEFIG